MRVQNTSGLEGSGIKLVIAGESGVGKTTLARTLQDTLGERVLLVSAEAGLLSLRGSGVDFIDLQTDEDGKPVAKEQRVSRLGQVYTWLLLPDQMAKYKWVYLDSLTEINQNMLETLEGNPEFSSAKDTIKKFGELSKRMRSLCKTFRDMPHYGVVFSALVKESADSDGAMKCNVDVIGSFAKRLPALFDEILYLGVTEDVDETTGKNKRVLLTQRTDRIEFPKDRSGRLERYEPADLGVVVRKIRGDAQTPVIADVSTQAKEASAKKPKAAKAPPVTTPAVSEVLQ